MDDDVADVNIQVRSLSGAGKARVAVAMLVVSLVTVLGELVTEYFRFDVLKQIEAAERVGIGVDQQLEQRAITADDLCAVASGIQIVTLLITAVCVLVWFYSAHKALRELGVEGLRYSPGWAVGGFLVPFLNLVRPYQVTQEIWKASNPRRIDSPLAWKRGSGNPMVFSWWFCWLAQNITGQISFRMSMSPNPSLKTVTSASLLALLSGGIQLVTGLLLIRIILAIGTRQEQRFLALGQRSRDTEAW
jgi:hypothetical protein